jgi:hypothetical protein
MPKPKNFERLLLQIARFKFEIKVAPAITTIKSGIPVEHKKFWEKMSCGDLYSIYTASSASVDKVIKMIDGCYTNNSCEERVLSYLKQYVESKQTTSLITICHW